jgi:hypothetical protein
MHLESKGMIESMNNMEFVKVINTAVGESAVYGTLKNLENLPGKKPAEQLVILSSWYKQLSEDDKEMVVKVMKAVVNSSIFGFLAVLDGVRIVEDNPDKGQFELYYVNGGDRKLLNDANEDYLHDIYKELI